jgi:Co/Zn/Cd efflux system component
MKASQMHHPGEEHGGDDPSRLFAEHTNRGNAHRDNNMRAAIIHVAADAAVSIFVIVGLSRLK